MKKSIDDYNKLSHRFALKQLEEKFRFELEASKKILKNNITLEQLINDSHNNELFTQDEYKRIYKKSLKLNEMSSIIDVYNDIIDIDGDKIEDINFFSQE